MLKKYVIKLSNSLNTINYLKAKSHSTTCRKSDAGYCNCDLQNDSDCSTSYSSSPIDSDDFNKNLFIENYCIKIPKNEAVDKKNPENSVEVRKTFISNNRSLAISNRNSLHTESSPYKTLLKRRTKSLTSEKSESSDDEETFKSNSYSPSIFDNDFCDKHISVLVLLICFYHYRSFLRIFSSSKKSTRKIFK